MPELNPTVLPLAQSLLNPSLWWAVGAALLLLLGLSAAWGVRYWQRYRCTRELAGDIAPQGVEVALRRYQPMALQGYPLEATAQLQQLLLTPQAVYTHWLLAAPDGSGKTTLLTRLYHRERWRWRAPLRLELMSLSSPDALLRVARIPHRERFILLLDGLDDDPIFAETPTERLDEILKATQGFARVLLSCDPAAWPGKWQLSDKGTALRFTGEETSQLFGLLPLRPVAGELAEKAHYLAPMTRLATDTQYLPSQRLLDHWLENSSQPKGIEEVAARRFWWKLAEAMQLRARQGMGHSVKEFQLEELRGRFADQWETSKLTRHLLWLDSIGRYRFVHGSLLALFRAEEVLSSEKVPDALTWRSLPRGAYYYQSLVWQRLTSDGSTQAWAYRTLETGDRVPLAAMRPRDLCRITRLYLPATALDQTPYFLPQLEQLKGIYFEGVSRQQIPSVWLEALPHQAVQLYLTEQDRVRQVLRFQGGNASDSPKDGEPDVLTLPSLALEPLRLRQQPDPTRPIYNPRGHRRGDRSLIGLLKLDLNRLLQEALQPSSGSGWVLDQTLSLAEWGLFNRARAFRLPDGTLNLILEQTIISTLLVQELRQLVPQLLATLGPDDDNLGPMGPDDAAQLEDGHWMGRRWLWQAHDRYAYPVHLFSDRPGCATLIIWGLSKSSPAPA